MAASAIRQKDDASFHNQCLNIQEFAAALFSTDQNLFDLSLYHLLLLSRDQIRGVISQTKQSLSMIIQVWVGTPQEHFNIPKGLYIKKVL